MEFKKFGRVLWGIDRDSEDLVEVERRFLDLVAPVVVWPSESSADQEMLWGWGRQAICRQGFS